MVGEKVACTTVFHTPVYAVTRKGAVLQAAVAAARSCQSASASNVLSVKCYLFCNKTLRSCISVCTFKI